MRQHRGLAASPPSRYTLKVERTCVLSFSMSGAAPPGALTAVADGIAAGGAEPHAPSDYGFMYQRQLNDPDGNILEFGWMDPVPAAQGPEAFTNPAGLRSRPWPHGTTGSTAGSREPWSSWASAGPC